MTFATVSLSGDREFAKIMFLHDGTAYCATHLGMPFGAVASVHAWHRIGREWSTNILLFRAEHVSSSGCLLRALGRRLLRIALLHYVDDFFGGICVLGQPLRDLIDGVHHFACYR